MFPHELSVRPSYTNFCSAFTENQTVKTNLASINSIENTMDRELDQTFQTSSVRRHLMLLRFRARPFQSFAPWQPTRDFWRSRTWRKRTWLWKLSRLLELTMGLCRSEMTWLISSGRNHIPGYALPIHSDSSSSVRDLVRFVR